MPFLPKVVAVIVAMVFWDLVERSYRRRAGRMMPKRSKPVRPHDDLRLTNL